MILSFALNKIENLGKFLIFIYDKIIKVNENEFQSTKFVCT